MLKSQVRLAATSTATPTKNASVLRAWMCSDRIPAPSTASPNPNPCLPSLNRTRRLLLQGSGLLLSTSFRRSNPLLAEEFQKQILTLTEAAGFEPPTCTDLPVTKSVFLDVSIDRDPAGRIVIGLYGDDVPLGASRFAELATGKRGVGYRKKEFVKITPTYIQNAGVRSYGVDAESVRGRLAADELLDEKSGLEKRCKGLKTFKGAVGVIVSDPAKPPSQIKVVAKGGKIEVTEEESRPDPNGTEFVIATKEAPELESSTLLVGRVLDGMDVVNKIAELKAVQENTKSPYFQVAKLIGDKRAVVAERGFNRPFSKIVITKCGELQ